MKIGLIDVDGHNYPNLALMKISAYYKAKADEVEWWQLGTHYDIVYVSKVFGDEYSTWDEPMIDADQIVYGGTGFAIKVENGKEVYHPELNPPLPDEIEHIYPDYDLYPEMTKDTAYGFLTRGCPNNCDFCIVSKKEGRCSYKVADLSEFWRGQKKIDLLDPNILACRELWDLLKQLAESGAKVNFNQGLDARFITPEVAILLSQIKVSMVHFAFDYMKNEKAIIRGLQNFAEYNSHINFRNRIVYILTNFDTTDEQDWYRVKKVRELGFNPDVRVYRKSTARRFTKDLQRWCNNRYIYQSCDFPDYSPRKNQVIKEIYNVNWDNPI